jgi:4-amino-4-deoxy-L-arabinose transferase-like glycosyltransferase
MRKTWLLPLLITALAAVLRLYRLADFPPGLHFDEAFHQVEAIGILRGHRPLYFTENMGMDPMHIYMIAGLYSLFGVTTIGGRFVSAIAGTLTVPATWWLAQELFADWEKPRRTAIGAIASFVLASLQWHLTFSRTGIQPSLVPLLLVLMVACLWRALRVGRWGWFAGAGVFLGAGPYAYSSSRVVPLLVVGVAAWLLLFERDTLRRRWPGLLLCVVVSVVVFAPLGAYFVAHWEWFTFRAGQVTFYTLGEGSSGPLRTLWDNTIKTLGAFSVRGDAELIRNLPNRPALDVFQSALFLLGAGVCVWRIRRPVYAALPMWVAVMLLPTILTEFAPHFGRALGATPAVALLVGLGAVAAWQGIDRLVGARWPRAQSTARWGVALGLALGLAASAVGHGYSYFVRWGSLPELNLPYDVGLLAATQEVRERVPEAEVYLSPISMGHPIPRFVLWDRPGARSYDGRAVLVLPPPLDRPADYVIVPELDKRSLSRLREAFPGGQVVASGGAGDGAPYYQVYRVPAGSEAHVDPQREVEVAWAERIGLVGYDVAPERCRPGDVVVLTLYWESLAPVEEAYTVFTHLLGPDRLWAGDDHEPGRASYPTSAWQPGEVVVDEYVWQVPADAPPGRYDIEVGLYQLATMQRLPISSSDVEAGTDYALVGEVIVD